MIELTPEQFALWTFERDMNVGCYLGDGIYRFNDLPQDEQDLYVEEGYFYLLEQQDNLPIDILQKMEKYNYCLPRI